MVRTVLAFTLALASCGASPSLSGGKINRTPLDAATLEQHKKLVAEGDAAWAERLDEAKLRAAITSWEQAVKVKDDDADTCQKLARAYYLLADGFLSFDEAKKAEYLATHLKGIDWAEHGLRAISTAYESRRAQGMKTEQAVMKLDRNAVPLMYWYDVNLGKWAKAQDTATVLQHKDRIFNIMSRVYELDPDYFYAAPDRYFGGYYAVAPTFAGGDPMKAKSYFEASLKKQPNYLATHVLIAELLAPKLQDRALAEYHLKVVLETPSDVIPDVKPEAEIEKKKAQKLLTTLDDTY
jgi:hypothetical protein